MQDRNLKHLIHENDDTKVQIISYNIRQSGCIALQHSGVRPIATAILWTLLVVLLCRPNLVVGSSLCD